MLHLLIFLAGVLLALYLYYRLNDQGLSQLPPEATTFAPNRFAPRVVIEAAETLSSSPKLIKNVLPVKTGRRYIVVGGVNNLIDISGFDADAYIT